MSNKPTFKLQPNEQVLLEIQPDQKIAVYWLLKKWTFWPIAIAIVYVLLASGTLPHTAHPLFAAILITILIMAAAWLWINFLRQWQWYIITNQRCILYWGFLTLQKKIVPHSKIVDIDMQQTIFERLLGIGSVALNVPSIAISAKGQQQNLLILYGLQKATCEQVINTISSSGA